MFQEAIEWFLTIYRALQDKALAGWALWSCIRTAASTVFVLLAIGENCASFNYGNMDGGINSILIFELVNQARKPFH